MKHEAFGSQTSLVCTRPVGSNGKVSELYDQFNTNLTYQNTWCGPVSEGRVKGNPVEGPMVHLTNPVPLGKSIFWISSNDYFGGFRAINTPSASLLELLITSRVEQHCNTLVQHIHTITKDRRTQSEPRQRLYRECA